MDAADASLDIEQFLEDRTTAFCEEKLDLACRVDDPIHNYCDFEAYVAKACASDPGSEATKNSCGGLTLRFPRAFGGHMTWHYDEKHELIGASLGADTTQYCGKREIQLGADCALTGEMVPLCTDDED